MQNTFLFIATLLAYFTKGITGFGNTLVMGSLFSFMVPNRLTTPVDLIFSIPTNIYIVWRERKNISLKIVVPISFMLLVGIIPGAFLLKVGNDRTLKSIMGLVIVGIAIEMLTRKPIESENKKNNTVFLAVIGVTSGILAGLYGITAPLISYISRATYNKNEFRGNICCIFLVDNAFRFFLYLYTGILNKDVFMLALFLSPAVFIGMILGVKVESNMKEETVKKAVIALLLISGIVLFLKNFLF